MTTFRTHTIRPWFWLALLLLALPVAAFAQTTGVGFQAISIHDPVNGGAMPGYVFYPSTQAKGVTRVGPYKLDATRNASAIPGAKPLVVISHGHGGSNLGHHDLAVYLASRGFIVATLQQPGDNWQDTSGTGKAVVLDGRPIQVKATISMLLHDPSWQTLIDPNRIGVTGFSAGGYTALMIVGAVPRFDRFVGYCKEQPQDAEDCALLQKWQSGGAAGAAEMKARLAALRAGLSRWGNPHDPRVKAAFVMAPLSLVFDKAGLTPIDRPVFLYYGQNDPVLIPKYNVLHIAPLIKTLVDIKMIPDAGHYVFLSPCSPSLAKNAPEICNDPPGVDRVMVHARINADALKFFRKTLDIPVHASR